MGYYTGRVHEVHVNAGGRLAATITCPAGAIPQPGQYILASIHNDPEAILGSPLFLSERIPEGFHTASPFPPTWGPGTSLDLVGPLGHGFDLPSHIQRLGLIALGESVSRLLPLVGENARTSGSITMFTDLPLPRLPAALESYPLASLAEMLDWPDFIAIDIPLARISDLWNVFGLPEGKGLPCPAQALVTTPIPCAGMAGCGVCAVPGRRGWKLACEDGPVFDLHTIKW